MSEKTDAIFMLRHANDFTDAQNDEDERMNAETDAFAKQVEGQVNK